MPGPVSDGFDPEFGTAANADIVREAIKAEADAISALLGPQLKNILEVCGGPEGDRIDTFLPKTERSLRIIRFALNYAMDVI